MNHCDRCRKEGGLCEDAMRLQAAHDNVKVILCSRDRCNQFANHEPGSYWCDDPVEKKAV